MNEIVECIISCLERQDVQDELAFVSSGASICNPVAGSVLQAFREIISIADDIRARKIVKGLASGLNQETYLNDIKKYVESNEEHATRIADMLRKAMLSDSEIVCVLMGRILADHISSNAKYDRTDIIVIHALESATDTDLIQFIEMINIANKRMVFDLEKYSDCIEWCLSTRLCKNDQEVKNECNVQTFTDCVFLKDEAYRLKQYLEEIKQVRPFFKN